MQPLNRLFSLCVSSCMYNLYTHSSVHILKQIQKIHENLFKVVVLCLIVLGVGIWMLIVFFIILVYAPPLSSSVNFWLSIFFFVYFTLSILFVGIVFSVCKKIYKFTILQIAGLYIGCTSLKSITSSNAAKRIFVLLFVLLILMKIQIIGYFVSFAILNPVVSIIMNNVAPCGMIFMIGVVFRYRNPVKSNNTSSPKPILSKK